MMIMLLLLLLLLLLLIAIGTLELQMYVSFQTLLHVTHLKLH